MQQTISINTNGRTETAKSVTRHLCRAAKLAADTLLSTRTSIAAIAAVAALMWWHNISIADTIAAQRAVGFDALAALPWMAIIAVRELSKGGEA